MPSLFLLIILISLSPFATRFLPLLFVFFPLLALSSSSPSTRFISWSSTFNPTSSLIWSSSTTSSLFFPFLDFVFLAAEFTTTVSDFLLANFVFFPDCLLLSISLSIFSHKLSLVSPFSTLTSSSLRSIISPTSISGTGDFLFLDLRVVFRFFTSSNMLTFVSLLSLPFTCSAFSSSLFSFTSWIPSSSISSSDDFLFLDLRLVFLFLSAVTLFTFACFLSLSFTCSLFSAAMPIFSSISTQSCTFPLFSFKFCFPSWLFSSSLSSSSDFLFFDLRFGFLSFISSKIFGSSTLFIFSWVFLRLRLLTAVFFSIKSPSSSLPYFSSTILCVCWTSSLTSSPHFLSTIFCSSSASSSTASLFESADSTSPGSGDNCFGEQFCSLLLFLPCSSISLFLLSSSFSIANNDSLVSLVVSSRPLLPRRFLEVPSTSFSILAAYFLVLVVFPDAFLLRVFLVRDLFS